ncbi:aminopeptidase [Christensenellaceae bacterium OttesenSCG-928-L17]|nr:aminopeptidase [Christensenellaceae bacterium OttesenSCG-928-L17]
MIDPRARKLAQNLIQFSCSLKAGEKVLIESIGQNDPLPHLLVEEAYNVGAVPFVWLNNPSVNRALYMNCTDEQLALRAEIDGALMQNMQAYIGVRGGNNSAELSDVPQAQMERVQRLYSEPVHGKIRVPHTKWVVLRYPTPSMAQLADMSTEAFEAYYFNVCNLDYSRMERAMQPLKELMERTENMHIVGNGTDLRFSIKGMNSIICAGHMNIPDGEIYTAPIRDSVNGTIHYNTPSLHSGFTYTDIVLTFKDGKIIDAQCNDIERINHVLNADEGARYIGEFALGVNPYINHPMKDTLFDEKIAGSFHFTPGSSYDDAFNGNKSSLHWDLVCIQTPEYGGGEIYFDDVLVRKDGLFVLPALQALNPERLLDTGDA